MFLSFFFIIFFIINFTFNINFNWNSVRLSVIAFIAISFYYCYWQFANEVALGYKYTKTNVPIMTHRGIASTCITAKCVGYGDEF